ncbi:MAG: amino acid ABC transporter permease [Erysipelotrichaceae bacterium]
MMISTVIKQLIIATAMPETNGFFEWVVYLFTNNIPLFIAGIQNTLLIALTGTCLGLVIGLVVGAIRATKVHPKDSFIIKLVKRFSIFLSSCYVEIFRGTPMMVQAMFIYYGLRPLIGWSALIAGIFIVTINTGAYMSEIIRAGIQSVPKGQSEAASALGFSTKQAMFNIILPQALRNAFPAIGNEFVVNIKDSSVLTVISVTELYFQTSSVAGTNYKYMEAFFIAACIYFTLTFTVTRILRFIEKRLSNTTSNFTGSQTTPDALTLKGED